MGVLYGHRAAAVALPHNPLGEVSEDKGAKQIVSQLRSWVNAPSLNRFSGLWLLNYAPGWPTPRRAGPHLAGLAHTSRNIGRGAPSALGHPAIPIRTGALPPRHDVGGG